jgi:hypothetical protein
MKIKIINFLFIVILFSCETETKKETETQVEPVIKNISFWGDSMTRGSGGAYTTISSVVSEKTMLNVNNFGNGGFNSSQVATLQGGNPLRLKLLNNEILPFNTGNTIIANYNILPFNAFTEQKRYGELNGIKGYLQRIPSSSNFNITERVEFIRLDSLNNYINTAEEVTFYFDDAENHKDDITVIWVGRNNERTIPEINVIKSDIAAMVNKLNNPKKFLIISICNGTLDDEKNNTNKYNNIIQLNHELELIYNERFLDLRKYMVNQAIYDSTIKPTIFDLEDINNDCIPRSLLYDLVHFNDLGYLLAGTFIANKIEELYIN